MPPIIKSVAALAALVLTLLLMTPLMEAKVVVFFPVPQTAYVRAHTNVARALTKMGHQAYVVVPKFMLHQNQIVNTDGLKVISYGDHIENVEKSLREPMLEKAWKGDYHMGLLTFIELRKVVQQMVRKILTDKGLLDELRHLRPHMFVITNHPLFRNLVFLPYLLGVPFAYLSPFNDLMAQRVSFSPALTPCPLNAQFHEDDISFFDRLRNAVCYLTLTIVPILNDNTLLADVAPHRPQIPISELYLQAEIYLIESDHILDYARPELPNVKVIGGTSAAPGKALTEPFRSFVENSKAGIALVTFGSGVLNIPKHVIAKMESAFQRQNLDVIWRVNFTSPDPDKILTSLWVPQNDILAHRNTKLFVSHCGTNGQYEALYHGVPMLCLPLVNDQHYNAKRSTSKGFGLSGSLSDLSGQQLADLMTEVATNDTYRNNIKKASIFFKQFYKVPAKEAAFWIDHVFEYGSSYMRSAGQDMPLYQFLVLDALLFIIVVILLIILFICGICFCCFRAVQRLLGVKSNSQKTKKA